MNNSPSPKLNDTPADSRWSKLIIGLITAVSLTVIVCGVLMGFQMYRFHRHSRVYERMKVAITQLSMNRPDDLTDDQWAYCILWTWNLHGNYGYLPYMPTDELEGIVEEFEVKSEADPSLETIDWLWDEYMRVAPSASHYEHFRPTLLENRSDFEAGAHGGNPLSNWQESYEKMVAE